MTVSRYKDFLLGNCGCHFHKVNTEFGRVLKAQERITCRLDCFFAVLLLFSRLFELQCWLLNVGQCCPGEIVQFLEVRMTVLPHKYTHCTNGGKSTLKSSKLMSTRANAYCHIISFSQPTKKSSSPIAALICLIILRVLHMNQVI